MTYKYEEVFNLKKSDLNRQVLKFVFLGIETPHIGGKLEREELLSFLNKKFHNLLTDSRINFIMIGPERGQLEISYKIYRESRTSSISYMTTKLTFQINRKLEVSLK